MRVFVYGTLRKNQYNYNTYYKDKSQFISYGYIKGTLYSLKDAIYPAFIEEGNTLVLGEIYELEATTSSRADTMEGYISKGNINNEYNKTILPIYDIGGKIIDRLPVYTFNISNLIHKQRLKDIIPSGDYIDYLNKKN